MTIIQDDYTFAKSERQGSNVPFATGGDCFSGNSNANCRKGIQYNIIKYFFPGTETNKACIIFFILFFKVS